METSMLDALTLVKDFGIPAHLRGYRYLQEAIAMTMEDMQAAGSITKLLYPPLAARHHVSSSIIERNIRNAIEEGWKNGNDVLCEKVFGYSRSKGARRPSNSEFIARAADWSRITAGE